MTRLLRRDSNNIVCTKQMRYNKINSRSFGIVILGGLVVYGFVVALPVIWVNAANHRTYHASPYNTYHSSIPSILDTEHMDVLWH